MCKVLCVTNRKLVEDDFFSQLERVVSAGVDGVILREKDLSEKEYEQLARRAEEICEAAHVPLILHTYLSVARELGIRRIHLPLGQALALGAAEKAEFEVLGVSTHSLEEARAAQDAGASYVTAGHVFATDCKKGLPPRGLSFLEEICGQVQIPVYAIGGISPDNWEDCMRAGACGVCLMSSFMKTKNPGKILDSINKKQK